MDEIFNSKDAKFWFYAVIMVIWGISSFLKATKKKIPQTLPQQNEAEEVLEEEIVFTENPYEIESEMDPMVNENFEDEVQVQQKEVVAPVVLPVRHQVMTPFAKKKVESAQNLNLGKMLSRRSLSSAFVLAEILRPPKAHRR